MKEIRFLKTFDIYNSGETAGFADSRADELVRSGIAAPIVNGKPVFPKAKAATDKAAADKAAADKADADKAAADKADAEKADADKAAADKAAADKAAKA